MEIDFDLLDILVFGDESIKLIKVSSINSIYPLVSDSRTL